MINNISDDENNKTPVENKTHKLRPTSGFNNPKNIDPVRTIRNTLPNIPYGDTPQVENQFPFLIPPTPPVENKDPLLMPPTPPLENHDPLLIPRFDPPAKKVSYSKTPPHRVERKTEEIVVLVDDDEEMLKPKKRDAYFYQKPEEYEKVVQHYYDKYDDDGTKKIKNPNTLSKNGKVYFDDRTNKRVTVIPIRQAVLGWVLDDGRRTKKLNSSLKWDVSRVTDMSNLFNCEKYLASSLDPEHEDIAWENAERKRKERNWRIEMEFKRSLTGKNDWKGNIIYNIFNNLNKWDVSNVTNMKDMFKYTDNLKNDELPKWYKKTPEDERIIKEEKQRKAKEEEEAKRRKAKGFEVPTVSCDCTDVSCDVGCPISGGKKRRTRKNIIKRKNTIKRRKTKKLRKKILKKTKKNRNKLKK